MAGGGPPSTRLLGLRKLSSSSIFGFYLLLLVVGNVATSVVNGELLKDKQSCSKTVSSWSEAQLHELSSLPQQSAVDRVKLRELLFFLHIPRTGGRTFHQCFLKHILPSDQRCPRSYDHLRIDRSRPKCRLISTHDDLSLLDHLPEDMTSVVTNLRDPVDRVLSAYEFSVEVAARSLRKPGRSLPGFQNRSRSAAVSQFMNTLDIWPWRFLVPTMQIDLFARLEERRAKDTNLTGFSEADSYDAAPIAMPFEEFLDHPAAHELVHNGATFQVAGLTNTSYLADAEAIRHCVIRYPDLGGLVLEVAKKRLDRMLYVGLTERQNDSVVFFAKAVGGQISMEGLMRGLLNSPGSETGGASGTRVPANFTSLDEFTEEEVIEEMLASYQACVGGLRKAQEHRRAVSLQTVKPIRFSRQMRKLIPDHVMERLAGLNSLDTVLYAHAKDLFEQQQKYLQDGDFHFMEQVKMSRGDIDETTEGLKDSYGGFTYSRESLAALWGLSTLWLLMIFMVLVLIMAMYVLTRRRGNRVKEF
ncbi:unnamed protein product [Calypogeia fissa]